MQVNEESDAAVVDEGASTQGNKSVDAAESVVGEPDATSETAEPQSSSDGDSGGPVPDMRSMISWAAMQLTPTELAQVLLPVFDARARVALGLLGDPRTGQAEENLVEARMAIDAVQFFLSRVENQFAESDRRELQRRLADLRMNFVSRQPKSE